MIKQIGTLLSVGAVVSLGAQTPAPAKNAAPAETLAVRAARIHKEAIVVDTHIDTTQHLGRPGWDFMARHQPPGAPSSTQTGGRADDGSSHVDYPRMKEGGLDAAFFSIYMAGTITGPEAVKRSLVLIDL